MLLHKANYLRAYFRHDFQCYVGKCIPHLDSGVTAWCFIFQPCLNKIFDCIFPGGVSDRYLYHVCKYSLFGLDRSWQKVDQQQSRPCFIHLPPSVPPSITFLFMYPTQLCVCWFSLLSTNQTMWSAYLSCSALSLYPRASYANFSISSLKTDW
jgi:hypothetical protein